MPLRKTHTLLLECIIAIVAVAAIASQFSFFLHSQRAATLSGAGVLLQFFGYFTILSNLLVAVLLGGRAWIRLSPRAPLPAHWFGAVAVSAVAVYIVLVGAVYALVLRNLVHFTGIAAISNFLLHDFVPVMFVVYWLVCVGRGTLRVRHVGRWLLFPLCYAIYTLVQGAYTGHYPYPFFDVRQLGYPRVLLNCAGLGMAVVLASLALVWIDGALGRRQGPHSPATPPRRSSTTP